MAEGLGRERIASSSRLLRVWLAITCYLPSLDRDGLRPGSTLERGACQLVPNITTNHRSPSGGTLYLLFLDLRSSTQPQFWTKTLRPRCPSNLRLSHEWRRTQINCIHRAQSHRGGTSEDPRRCPNISRFSSVILGDPIIAFKE
jgi:hypothetical protein